MPDDLKARVQEAAEANGRSLHAELLARLEQSFGGEDPEQLQLMISRLEGELSGSKFVANALLEETSKRMGEMALSQATAMLQAHQMCGLFDEMSDLAERYRDGEVKDMALASVQFDTLVSERLAIENSLDDVEFPGEKSAAERIAEGAGLMEAAQRKANRKTGRKPRKPKS